MLKLGLKQCTKCALHHIRVSNGQYLQKVIQPQFIIPQFEITRNTSFFTKVTASEMWKALTTVSNPGKRRGRGKNIKPTVDLHRGQVIGIGKANIIWPGLTVPVFQGGELVEQQQLNENVDIQAEIIRRRQEQTKKKFRGVHPLDRGWSGRKKTGQKFGPPELAGEEKLEGFDSMLLEHKVVCKMTGNLGRLSRFSSFVVTGNGNGLVGFGMGLSGTPMNAIKTARNRAGSKLMFIERFEDHTVYHDMFSQFGSTKIFIKKKPKGYGLVCHRAIKGICQLVGITDLYAKVEGSRNIQNVIKAFFLALLEQKTHRQIAQEKRLHVVEFTKERNFYPKVVASPSKCLTPEEADADPLRDFQRYVLDGKIVLNNCNILATKPVHENQIRSLKNLNRKSREFQVRINLQAKYGATHSFLTKKYPECEHKRFFKKSTT